MPLATALYSTSEIRSIELAAQKVLPAGMLMQRAGESAATFALELLQGSGAPAKVLILAGPGNNGGDAFEVAHRLTHAGLEVTALFFDDTARQPTDANAALLRAQASAVRLVGAADWQLVLSEQWDLVIDGLFGIGLARPISGTLRSVIEAVNELPCPLLALDVPSGLDAETGNIVGTDGVAINASHTITFIGDKPGLHTANGRDYAGTVRVSSLQIDDAYFKPYRAELNDVQLFGHFFRKRSHNSHKGSFGDVTIIGGAHGMSGAVILAARTAAKCGAGRVFASFLDDTPLYDSAQPELMCRDATSVALAKTTLVIGPGLGTSSRAHDVLIRTLNTNEPLVLDADALNLVAADSSLQKMLANRAGPSVITPHPLEAARLLGVTNTVIQGDRLAAARTLASRFNCVVVLKGSGTIIATANQRVAVNPTGNPALATAGTGDVLAGMCAALLAQGLPAREATLAAVWLHGHAADVLVQQGVGPVGLTASDLIPELRASLNRLIEQHAQHYLPR